MRSSKCAALALVGTFAFCANAFAQNPGTLPMPGPNSGNGGAMISIFNPSTNVSLVEYLGVDFNDLSEATLTPDSGYVLNFNPIDLSPLGGDLSGFVYEISAGGDTTLLTTVSEPFVITNQLLAGPLQNLEAFTTNFNSNGVNPAFSNSAADAFNAASQLGTTYGAVVPGSAAGAIGTALDFVALSDSGGRNTDDADQTIYQNAYGTGQWLLTSNGELSYSIAGAAPTVPLPAAVWLLMSGLAGFGAVSRRRQAALA